jgi:hypothetical protein
MEGLWDDEVARRRENLKCSVCNGTNPYVCECAKKAYLEQMKPPSPSPPSVTKKARTLTDEQQLEQEWISHTMLVCSPSMEACPVCKPKSSKSFCHCAKKKWIEWKKSGGWDTGAPPPIK